jgi:hypothetical protein
MTRTKLGVGSLAALAAWAGSPGVAMACSTCYGQAEGPMIDAARVGTFLLLGVVLSLQVAFAAFFLYLRRRAARVGRDASGRPVEWRSA